MANDPPKINSAGDNPTGFGDEGELPRGDAQAEPYVSRGDLPTADLEALEEVAPELAAEQQAVQLKEAGVARGD